MSTDKKVEMESHLVTGQDHREQCLVAAGQYFVAVKQYLVAAVNMLAPTCSRWVSLHLEHINPVDTLQGIRFDLAHELRELRIPLLHTPYTPVGEVQRRTFLTSVFMAPQLKSLELNSGSDQNINILQLAPNFSWHSLIHLDLFWNCPWEFVAQAISKCTSIVFLTICVPESINDMDAFPKNVVLPNLKVLRIKYKSIDAFALFSSLECFNLCVLEIEPEHFGRSRSPPVLEGPFGLLASFLEHGRHRLQVFGLLVRAVPELDDSITNVLLSCRRADVFDVGLAIGDSRRYHDDLMDRLEVIGEALVDVPTGLPPFVIRSRPLAIYTVVGWSDRSRMTIWWQRCWRWDILDTEVEHGDDPC